MSGLRHERFRYGIAVRGAVLSIDTSNRGRGSGAQTNWTDLADVPPLDLWVAAEQALEVRSHFMLLPSSQANVTLRTVPQQMVNTLTGQVPKLIAAADLSDRTDPRSQQAARTLFSQCGAA